MGLRWIDAVLVVAYLVAILAIGLRFAHRQTTTETYFVAKRSIPAWALGLSMLATIISAVTFIAYPGAGYAGDWSLLVPGVMSVVGLGKNPLAVDEHEISAVQNVVKSGLTYQPSGFICTGQMARVERGPLRGLVGIVVATKKNCRLVISVNLLQRSVWVEIDSDSVMPVSPAGQQAAIARV